MSMASFQIDYTTVHHGPPGAYNIQGQVYCNIGPLLPLQDAPPTLLQCNCNIDYVYTNTADLFTLGEQNAVCKYCGTLGFSSENCGTEE